ncbi:MAG: hypothetical protein WB502_14655 [Thermoactinomyces sp.]|jgi:hypothetical protein
MGKIKFIYVRREDGTQPALELIAKTAKLARQGHPDFIRMAIEITNGIKAIEKTGIPPWKLINEQPFFIETPAGKLIRVEWLKRLEYNFPLAEFRVSTGFCPTGHAFQMVLFTHFYQGREYVFATNAVIKRQTSSPEFDEIVKEAAKIYKDFLRCPTKYIQMGDWYERSKKS